MNIDVLCNLSNFRQFMILSTCYSFIPPEYMRDENVFPEREAEKGTMYVEAEDKETLKTVNGIVFVRASEVLGVIYASKSGRTKLKWRIMRSGMGRLVGEASNNSLVNLYASEVLDKSYAYTGELKQ